MDTEYKLIYKQFNMTTWKHFYYNAESDLKALLEASEWINKHHVEAYQVEKITIERLV